MSDAELWVGTVALFWVLPAIVGAWIGRAKGRDGAGLLLGILVSWLGVLIVSLLSAHAATDGTSSRSNIGVLLGVLGIVGAVVWSLYSYDTRPAQIDVEATVAALIGEQVSCSPAGFMLLQGRNAEAFNCVRAFSSPPRPSGCFAVVEDIVYDVTPQFGRKSC